MVVIINFRNMPIYTKRIQDKALLDFGNIAHNLEKEIHKICTRQITSNWKTWLNTILNEARALTGQHNAITKRIFTQLILQLLQCPHQGAERLNYFTTFKNGLKEIVKILNYSGHPQRRNKKKKDMTRKLHTFKSKQAIFMAHSVSSIVTKHTLNGLANYLITMINIIRNEE